MNTKTIRLKVKREAYPWLNRAAREVNQVWNWANDTSHKAIRRYFGAPKWLAGFDLCKLSSGATECFAHIGAGTINRVCIEYANNRLAGKHSKLSWRKSGGARKSLGWVPFKGENISRKGRSVRFCGKTFRVFDTGRLDDHKFRDGCFAEDACGDWWLCIPVAIEATDAPAPLDAVGIDLGLKTIATTSDGDTLEAGRWIHAAAEKLANAQRRGHKRQAKRIHRKIARQRQDALHKFSRKIVNQYQTIIVGDVSSSRLKKTSMAKSVSDSGWYILKTQLQYKGAHAGRCVHIVNESYTTRACSGCGALTGPAGRTGLVVREFRCDACGVTHSRDVNAARNIRTLGLRYKPPLAGTGNLSHDYRVAEHPVGLPEGWVAGP